MTSKLSKRILSVTVKRMYDESPDTSWLGEYGSKPTSDYSIDRAHDADCMELESNHRAVVDQLERIWQYLSLERDTIDSYTDEKGKYLALDDAQDLIISAQDECQECSCGRSYWDPREYRYFNPNHENYKGSTDAEIRQYCQQDYERMEGLQRGDWCFMGVRVDARIVVADVIQDITSAGCWGVESDSDDDHFAELEGDEASECKAQLAALGFSKRAIATAWKEVERKEC